MSVINYAKACPDIDARKAKIIGILSRGNIAVFSTGQVIKKVKSWNEDADGFLEAFESTGLTNKVSWGAVDYELTEEHAL